MKTEYIWKKSFKNNSFDRRVSAYLDILSSHDEIRSEKELLDILKERFPEDESINPSRVGRDLRKFADSMKLGVSDRPIVAIKRWMKKYHINTRMKDMFCDVTDFSMCETGIFLKVEPYQAELFGQTIRQAYESSHCFVISDYDTVFVHFGTKEIYTDFLNICRQFVPGFKIKEIPESR